jgi:hypothetical protein
MELAGPSMGVFVEPFKSGIQVQEPGIYLFNWCVTYTSGTGVRVALRSVLGPVLEQGQVELGAAGNTCSSGTIFIGGGDTITLANVGTNSLILATTGGTVAQLSLVLIKITIF